MERIEARYFEVLLEAAKTINSTLDTDEVLSTIVKTVTVATRAKGCSLMLSDEEKKYLVHKITYGQSGQYLQKGVIMADTILAAAVKGEPIVVSDVSTDSRLQYPMEAVKEGVASMLSVPLAERGVTMGVMRIYSAQKGDFSADAIKLLTAIANLSALAIENARMYDSLKKAHEVCQRELWHLQP